MAVLSTKQRKKLSKSSFAVPSKAPGSGSYPINDPTHARNALARVSQFGSPSEKAAVRSKVASKYPGIEQAPKKSRKIVRHSPEMPEVDCSKLYSMKKV